MGNNNCTNCKEEIDMNPQFRLKELTMVGYTEREFCDTKCFICYIFKRFKNKLKRMVKNEK